MTNDIIVGKYSKGGIGDVPKGKRPVPPIGQNGNKKSMTLNEIFEKATELKWKSEIVLCGGFKRCNEKSFESKDKRCQECLDDCFDAIENAIKENDKKDG
jgi:hypothetical protein